MLCIDVSDAHTLKANGSQQDCFVSQRFDVLTKMSLPLTRDTSLDSTYVPASKASRKNNGKQLMQVIKFMPYSCTAI